jgi:hypothetical protein
MILNLKDLFLHPPCTALSNAFYLIGLGERGVYGVGPTPKLPMRGFTPDIPHIHCNTKLQ